MSSDRAAEASTGTRLWVASAPLVVAMLSVGILISWLSNVLPLGLGLADGTNYALYGLLGASPEAGLVFTMTARFVRPGVTHLLRMWRGRRPGRPIASGGDPS